MIKIVGNIAHVQSSRKKTIHYHVCYSGILHRWICDCPHFIFRLLDKGGECKHIREVKQYQKEESKNVIYTNANKKCISGD